MTSSDQLLLVNAGVPVNSLEELVAKASDEDASFPYGSFGNGSQPHLLSETLNHNKNIDLIHAPYKGVAPMLTGLAGGETQYGVGSANVVGASIEAGRIRPIAIAGESRSTFFPDVPTTGEAPRGLDLVAGGPQELAAAIQKDVRLTQAMVEAAGVKPE